MTNYADYPTTERFWKLVEELGIIEPKCDHVWQEYEANGGMYKCVTSLEMFRYHELSQHRFRFFALDPNALLSWEWLTKPRIKNTDPYNFNCLRMGAWRVNHQYSTRQEFKLYFHTATDLSLAQCLTDYAIKLMEYERGEK